MNYFADPIVIEGNALFVSDAHLGVPSAKESLQREEWLVQLLSEKKDEIQHLFFLGDMFDFWFEYRDVVPKGYFRLFNILYEMNKAGINIYFFTGNHDMWVKNYFADEFGFTILRKQQLFVLNGKRYLIGHGDGLGKGDYGYKFIKKLFAFKPNVWLYGLLPPRQAFAIANYFSHKSRAMTSATEAVMTSPENERLFVYASEMVKEMDIDGFIYGHRHLPLDLPLNEKSRYLNIGDWLTHNSYGRVSPEGMKLCFWNNNNS